MNPCTSGRPVNQPMSTDSNTNGLFGGVTTTGTGAGGAGGGVGSGSGIKHTW